MTIIDIQNLTKRFGNYPAVNNVTMAVEEGDSFALLGPNGAGKTTLVRILGTLIKPNSGTVRIAGYDITEEQEEVKRVIGVVSHNPYLYDELSARENLDFFASAYGVPKEKTESLLERVGLLFRADDLVGTFSRGMKQRLSIARVLLHEPKVLILDEPSTGLDLKGRRIFYEILEELHSEGRTLLLTTHQMEEAERLCKKAAIMHKGTIKASGELSALKGKTSLEEAFLELTEEVE